MLNQFHKNNLKEQWEIDLANDFPEFFLEPSEEVLKIWEEYHETGDMPRNKEDLCNLRYGMEFRSGWSGIARDHFESIRKLIQKAKDNGHDLGYKGFIIKQKWHTLRDQSDLIGEDRKLYYKEYSNLVEDLYDKSTKVDEKTGEPINQAFERLF